jgi:23S rRNA (guanosine2251-2'-O)-methyltransferase
MKMQKRQKSKNQEKKSQRKPKNPLNPRNKDLYVISGKNTILDGLKAGNVQKVFISKNIDKSTKVLQIIEDCKKLGIKAEFIDKKEIDKLSGDSEYNQGVAAISKKSKKIDLVDFLDNTDKDESVCLVMLTEIEYEQNLGAILRTIDASGVDGIILSNRIKNTDSNVVRRVSMGASENVNVFVQNIFIASRMLKERGFKVIGVESTGDGYYVNSDLSGRIALVFGGEDKSLSESVTSICDSVVSIPMAGNVTSLNVSVSVAIVVYERLRQLINKVKSNNIQ